MKTASLKSATRNLLAIAGLSSIAFAGITWAEGPRHATPDSARMLQHRSSELDLSEEQKNSIGQLLAAAKEQSSEDRARARELRKLLQQQQSAFDAGEAQSLADELGQVTARLAFQGASTHAQLYQQLTPEQREKFDELQNKRDSRKGRHGHHKRERSKAGD